jgi:hypothetical protein
MDPDKKVEKKRRRRLSVYQSSQNRKPFKNEGSEFGARKEGIEVNNDTKENADFDKIKGVKK